MSTIYTPDQAAHKCLNTSIIQLSFSRPRNGIDETKARLRRITIKGKAAYQLETVKNKQAFQKTIEPEAVSGTIAECFTRFKAAECRGQKEQLFFLQNQAAPLLHPARRKQLRRAQQDKELSYSRRDTARVLDRTGGDECGGRRLKAKIL